MQIIRSNSKYEVETIKKNMQKKTNPNTSARTVGRREDYSFQSMKAG